MDRGYKNRFFTIEFMFESDVGGSPNTAIDYLEDLEALWFGEHSTYVYQRKLTILQADGSTRVINGKIGNVSSHVMHGADFSKLEGKFDFKEDTKSTQVP